MTDMAFRAERLLQRQAESSGGAQTAEQRQRAIRRLASLGEMTGGIAHDLRNILAIVESGLRLAERKADQPESVRAFIAAAREGVARGVELISQLLAFADDREPNLQVRDLNELVSFSAPFLRYGAGPGVRVRLELGSDIPSCLIDPALFDAAVLNIVLNARDALRGGGEIWIGTERLVATNCAPGGPAPGTYARLRVKDKGCGMSQEVLQKVQSICCFHCPTRPLRLRCCLRRSRANPQGPVPRHSHRHLPTSPSKPDRNIAACRVRDGAHPPLNAALPRSS
ncbi:signal transduction histidine kinase [Sinorhizobium fredii]